MNQAPRNIFNKNYEPKQNFKKTKPSRHVETLEQFLLRGGKIQFIPYSMPITDTLSSKGCFVI